MHGHPLTDLNFNKGCPKIFKSISQINRMILEDKEKRMHDRQLSIFLLSDGGCPCFAMIPEPFPRRVYVLDSVKRPEEVDTLRKVYGPGFFLIGIYATEEERQSYLVKDKNIDPQIASELIKRDADEHTPYGQRTRDSFHLADVFIRLRGEEYKEQLWRFLNLVFSEPFSTPTPEEHAMYLAYAASLRSADLARQVGAAVTSALGDIISVGCNDVPRAGGGLYWPGKEDCRDYTDAYGCDSNTKQKEGIIEEIVRNCPMNSKIKGDVSYLCKKGLRKSGITQITEYGRTVHAEMEALLACLRGGISPINGTLYTTTFPCHNCTRHIVAAGIRRVVYIEPYPKSFALALHDDSIIVDPAPAELGSESDKEVPREKVRYESFVGIGPRRYWDLFSVRPSGGRIITRKKDDGTAIKWKPGHDCPIRVPMIPTSYLQREQIAVSEIAGAIKKLQG
jgi:deoxycytidylate deaminase